MTQAEKFDTNAADQERVDAITEAGFDPCATSRKPSSPSPF